jgi:hypothetical protein
VTRNWPLHRHDILRVIKHRIKNGEEDRCSGDKDSKCVDDAGDVVRVRKEVHVRQQVIPVVDGRFAAEKLKIFSKGVVDVHGDVHQILSDPDGNEGRQERLAVPPGGDETNDGDEQLEQRSTEHADEQAHEPEDEMSGFMEHQIRPVNDVPRIRMQDAIKEIDPDRQRRSEPLPVDGKEFLVRVDEDASHAPVVYVGAAVRTRDEGVVAWLRGCVVA